MFNWNWIKFNKPLKGYKITNNNRTNKYGIAVNSLKMLKRKACEKFNMTECKIYLASEGVEINDESYFTTIEPQTLLLVASYNDVVKTDFELLCQAMLKNDIVQAGAYTKKFLMENQSEIVRVLLSAQNDDKTKFSRKEEHLEWFQGSEIKASNKEQVLSDKSKNRIQNYYYKTRDEIKKSKLYRTNKSARDLVDNLLKIFSIFLVQVDYFGCLFNRKYLKKHEMWKDTDDIDSGKPVTKKIKLGIESSLKVNNELEKVCLSLCSIDGLFKCQGKWNTQICNSNHVINPYSSRENLLLFQMWNWDHQIEISRTVIPSIIENIDKLTQNDSVCTKHNKIGKNVTVIKYFLELFTIDNLKLVHIVCHDKKMHALSSGGGIICEKCDEYKFLNTIQSELGKQ